jgi:hypothetical protein
MALNAKLLLPTLMTSRGWFFAIFVTKNDIEKVKPVSESEKLEKNYGKIRLVKK